MRNKANLPGGIRTSSNIVYRLGGEAFSDQDMEKLASVAPQLAKIVQSAREAQGAVDSLGKSVHAEAQAEQEKIGIAKKEGAAIDKNTQSYNRYAEAVSRAIAQDHKSGGEHRSSAITTANKPVGWTDRKNTQFSPEEDERFEEELSNLRSTEAVTGTPTYQSTFNQRKAGFISKISGQLADKVQQSLFEL